MNMERFSGLFHGLHFPLDRGVDSVVTQEGALVRHYYPFLDEYKLREYRKVMKQAGDMLSVHPLTRRLYHTYAVVLQDVVSMREPTYDQEAGCWTMDADYIVGPHLSEICFAPLQNREGLLQLAPEEQARLTDFRMFLRSRGLISEISDMLGEAGRLLRSKLKTEGIEPTTLNTKARAYVPGQINLIITDLCPSIERMMRR